MFNLNGSTRTLIYLLLDFGICMHSVGMYVYVYMCADVQPYMHIFVRAFARVHICVKKECAIHHCE